MPVKGGGKEGEVGRKVVRQQSGSEKVRFSTPATLGSVSQLDSSERKSL